MERNIEEFTSQFMELCNAHKFYPIGGHDGEIYLGYDEDSETAYFFSWQKGEEEQLQQAKLRTITHMTHETTMGNITTVTPTTQNVS